MVARRESRHSRRGSSTRGDCVTNRLAALDWIVIAVYFGLTFGVAIWATLQERRRISARLAELESGRSETPAPPK